MPDFETLDSTKIEFGEGGEFLELSINVARDGKRETRYIRLARGYRDEGGNPRYRKGGVTLPRDAQALRKLAEALAALDLSKLDSGKPPG